MCATVCLRISLCSPILAAKCWTKALFNSFPLHAFEFLFNSKIGVREWKQDDSYTGFQKESGYFFVYFPEFHPSKNQGASRLEYTLRSKTMPNCAI